MHFIKEMNDKRISPNARTEVKKNIQEQMFFVMSARRCWCKRDSSGDLSYVSNFEESGIFLILKRLLM